MRPALEGIYREHRQGLYTLALAITRRADRAEDAVQEAFARLWRSGARPAGDAVAYVFAAVRNAAVDQGRRAAAETAVDPASIFNGLPADPAQAVLDAERHARVRDAVETLPQAEREAVVLRVYGGLTFEQMAEALGEPLATVASRYRRATERLERRLRREVGADHE